MNTETLPTHPSKNRQAGRRMNRVEQEIHERLTMTIHEELSPLLTDSLGVEHGWDAAEGVASVIVKSGEWNASSREIRLYSQLLSLQESLKQHMAINLELNERLEASGVK